MTDSQCHTLLAKVRRRTVLSVLTRRSSAVDLTELAAAVAGREDGADLDGETAVKRVSVTFHHDHLPRLDAYDVISYDSERRPVRP